VSTPIAVSILYVHGVIKLDVDNIPKFLLDALKGEVFVDDSQIERLVIERLPLEGRSRLSHVPPEVATGFDSGSPFLFVTVAAYSMGEVVI
jgi:hypothetical protein